jgi:hypothetical protein
MGVLKKFSRGVVASRGVVKLQHAPEPQERLMLWSIKR